MTDGTAAVSPDLLRHWVHVHEEDTPTEQVYRPSGTKLPPARGRRGIELQPGGAAIRYGIAAGDGGTQEVGRWTAAPDGRIDLSFGGASTPMTVVAVTPDELRVRREEE
jgi:hypothetical protein